MHMRTRLMLRPLFGIVALLVACLPAAALPLTGSLDIHDPSRVVKDGNRYYVFATGSAASPINMKYSDDLTRWFAAPGGAVVSSIPQWAQQEVPGNAPPNGDGNMWAPSIFHFNNEYRLYYSVSSFGSQESVIGLATNTTLDFFNDPNYQWVDQQLVVKSEVGDSYNAIDPAIFYDDDTQKMWMSWGSFWDGIFVTELDPDTGKRITPDSPIVNVADRSSIEASYMLKHDDYYYLFVNHGSCCRGVNSTYRIRVGRGTSPTGPFVDRDGDDMLNGGGELFLGTEDNFIGPGHFSSFSEDGVDYFGFHYYDGNSGGAARYAIREYDWTEDDWPEALPEPPVPPAGDYNGDFVVNAADYTVWRNTLGSTTDLRANGSNFGPSAGVIDQFDYLVWRSNFGTSALDGSGAASSFAEVPAVPEPSSLAVAFITVAALVLRRHSQAE